MYSPTADKNEDDIEILYETAMKAMKQLKSYDNRIVMEDFNSKVGSERSGNIIGQVCNR